MFDVVFTDYSMDGMNGPELAMRIRLLYDEFNATKQPYICCCSAYNEDSFMDAAFEAGIDQFLVKPVS